LILASENNQDKIVEYLLGVNEATVGLDPYKLIPHIFIKGLGNIWECK